MPGLQKIPRETFLAAIEKLGPCQPIDIRKELKLGDTFLIGAMLSELVAEQFLAITKVKRGGSPFYYDVTKPERLDAVSKYLNEKDRRTYALLKEQRVMSEDGQEPLVRVGLQNMPDFSKRIDVDGTIYWRYYLVDEDEARRLIGKTSSDKPESEVVPEKKTSKKTEETVVVSDEAHPVVSGESNIDLSAARQKEDVTTASPPEKTKKGRKKKDVSAPSTNASSATTDSSAQQIAEQTVEPAAPQKKSSSKKRASKKTPAPTIMPDGAVMISPQEWLEHDTLYARVQKFAGDVALRDARVHKPHSELTCLLAVETQFGKLDVFVHAFNKKFLVDDVKNTMPAARELGLPLLILSVDPIPSKITSAFKGMPNIIFKTL